MDDLVETVVKVARQKKSWLAIYALAVEAFLVDKPKDRSSDAYIPAIEKAVELGLLERDISRVKYKPQPRKKREQRELF